MRTLMNVVVLCAALASWPGLAAADGTDAAADGGSAAIPADFPFPDGADPNVTTAETAGGRQHVVSFSFREDADVVYEAFRAWAKNDGYSIATESRDSYRFSATRDTRHGIAVGISDMGSVRIGTVTFSVPADQGTSD